MDESLEEIIPLPTSFLESSDVDENLGEIIPLPRSFFTARDMDEDHLMLGERVYEIEKVNLCDIYPSIQHIFHCCDNFSSLQSLNISSNDLNLTHVNLLKYMESSLVVLESVAYTQIENTVHQPLVLLLSELSSITVLIYEAFDPNDVNFTFYSFPYYFWYDYLIRIRKGTENSHEIYSWRVDRQFFHLNTIDDNSSCQSPDLNVIYELSYSINKSLKDIDPSCIAKLILVDVEKYTRNQSLTNSEQKAMKEILEQDLYECYQFWYNIRSNQFHLYK